MERVNKRRIDPVVYKNFVNSCRQNNEMNQTKKYHLFDLFKTPHLRKVTLLLIVIYMSVSLIYDGYIRSITSIGLNIFTAFTLASATEFPASSTLTLLLDRLGRRWFLFGTMIVCSICSLALSFSINGNGSEIFYGLQNLKIICFIFRLSITIYEFDDHWSLPH